MSNTRLVAVFWRGKACQGKKPPTYSRKGPLIPGREEHKRIFVILYLNFGLIACSRFDYYTKAFEYAALHFITKPIGREDLKEAISRVKVREEHNPNAYGNQLDVLSGVDFTDDINGTTVKATADGKVHYIITWQGDDHGMGTTIILQHRLSNGLVRYSLYSHLNSVAAGLAVGNLVDKGQSIGVMGASGYNCATYWCNTNCTATVGCSNTHLHFEIKNSGILSNPSGTGAYYGYTPNAPSGYGYQDPLYYMNNSSITVIPQPDLTAPLDGAINVQTNGLLDWASVSGATNYRVQIKVGNQNGWTPENGFTSSTGTSTSIPVNATTGSASQWSGNLSPNTTYYWTVRVANSSSNSFYSKPIRFTTASNTAPTPTTVNASDGTYSNRVSITWSSSAPYKKVWRGSSSSSSSGMTALTGWITSNSFNDYNASPGVTYYYRVQAANSSSGSGASGYSSYNTGYRASGRGNLPPSNEYSYGQTDDKGIEPGNGVIPEPEITKGITAFKLYPNPVSDGNSLNIEIYAEEANEESAQVLISNTAGTISQTIIIDKLSQGPNLINFSSANLPPGIYLCTVKTLNNRVSQRFIVVK